MKISIIMPTYNDACSIVETLNSVTSQTYDNWQLIIMDDGSKDNTKQVIQEYIRENNCEDKIEYHYQENQDQLNAISNAIKFINGDYVYILHSDDLLPSKDVFEKLVNVAKENKDTDVFIGDLIIIDENSKETGIQKVRDYMHASRSLPELMLWLGRNLYSDVIFAKKEIFISDIHYSYLTWNMPFWTQLGDEANILNVKNTDFPILKYRIHGENYINNELGKLNVINGELRTISRLMKFYSIPLYTKQFYAYRIFNKLKLNKVFNIIHLKREEKNKAEIIEFVIKKRFGEEYVNNAYLKSLVNFYRNLSDKKITIDKINEDEKIYKGKDMRAFNKSLVEKNLSELYSHIISKMNDGFNEIIVVDEIDKEKVIDITKFLCIYPYVKVTVKE